jgi:hypothetical protein
MTESTVIYIGGMCPALLAGRNVCVLADSPIGDVDGALKFQCSLSSSL